MPVHFAGLMVHPGELADFSAHHGLVVVEDAAHAFPASRDGRSVGTSSSDAVVFSFYATKTMTTGEGGMVVTRNPDLAARIRMMRLHGIDRDAFARYRSEVPSWEYRVLAPGYKYNLADPAAALGLVQLRRAHQMRLRRTEIAERYLAEFADLDIELPPEGEARTDHSWHLFVVRVPSRLQRNAVIDELSARGVGTSVHFIPLHLQPYWCERGGLRRADFPIASAEFERVISLPIYSAMTDTQLDHVVAGVREVLS